MMRKLFYAAAAFILAACGSPANQNETTEKAPERNAMVVTTSACEMSYDIPANLRGMQDIEIRPEVSAKLEQVLVKEGQRVTKGQRLFALSQTAFEAALENAKSQMNMAKAQLATADNEVMAKKQLLDKGIISEYEYNNSVNAQATAKSQLDAAKAAVTAAQNDLNHTVICAPSDGVIGNINYRQGSLVGPSMPQPLTIASNNTSVYAYFSITEKDYLEFIHYYGSTDSLLAILPDAQLVLNDGSLYSEKGRVETVSGTIDQQTGSLSCRAAFPNPNFILATGGSAQLRMTYSDIDAIVIPRSAVFEIQNKTYVFKVVEENGTSKTAQSIIEGMRYNDKELIVTSGLNDGEVILTEHANMTDGKVIVPVFEKKESAE